MEENINTTIPLNPQSYNSNNYQYGTHPTVQPDSDDVKMCRNCHETGGDDLFSPCKCTGSMKYVHKSCLNQWRV